MKNTKNLILTSVALTIALYSSVQLFAMEPEEASDESFDAPYVIALNQSIGIKPENILNNNDSRYLSTAIKKLINIILDNSHDDIAQAIVNIQQMSKINPTLKDVLNDLPSFTELVHILEDRSNLTTEEIAKKIDTPTAQQYINLGNKLLGTIIMPYSQTFTKLVMKYITDGADINFSALKTSAKTSILQKAVYSYEPEKVAFLLELGATPDKALASIQQFSINNQQYGLIKSLLEAAVKQRSKMQ